MNKTDLQVWKKYIDTDKLVDEIAELLTAYHHGFTEHGLCVMLNNFFIAKEPLIKLLASSKHYEGNLRIRLPKELVRYNSRSDILEFCFRFSRNDSIKNAIVSKTDGNGKTFYDYLKVGSKKILASRLAETNLHSLERDVNLGAFNNYGDYLESIRRYNKFSRIVNTFGHNYQQLVTDSTERAVNSTDITLKLREGQKTSRAFNKVCEAYGVNKVAEYNKLYAQYSDMVSDLKRKVDFIISVNPYDYLTMSFGVNWSSCHSIDKNNQRGIPGHYHGQYCNGTVSYMLDSTSIITFVIDRDGDVHDGKIYRNMFHYHDKYLIQSRVYPQGNDGNTDLYETFRGFMHEEFSELLGNNQWKYLGEKNVIAELTNSVGTHYRDYLYNSGCNASCIDGAEITTQFTIGATSVCTKCGLSISSNGVLSHTYC